MDASMNQAFCADAAPRAGAGDALIGFSARVGGDEIGLLLQDRGVMPARLDDTVRAALLLDRVEPLLQWLEDGLGGVPLCPAPAVPQRTAGHVQARWRDAAIEAQLFLPWPLLLRLRASAPAPGEWQWQPVAVELTLSRQVLDDSEWQVLQREGAALLLPESFGAPWPCELGLRDAGWTWQARWQPARRELQWQAMPQPAQADEPPPAEVQVRLHAPLLLTPPQLLGWHGAPGTVLPADTLLRVCRSRADALSPPLLGRLLPVGLRAPQADDEPAAWAEPLRPGYLVRMEGRA
jgi:hypothetical protein